MYGKVNSFVVGGCLEGTPLFCSMFFAYLPVSLWQHAGKQPVWWLAAASAEA